MFASVLEGLQECSGYFADKIFGATIRDIQNLRSGVKISKSITRLMTTCGTATILSTLLSTGILPLPGLESLMSKLIAIGTITAVGSWFASELSKIIHKQIVRYQSHPDHLNPDVYIRPFKIGPTNEPIYLSFTNSRLFVRRDRLTAAVTEFYRTFWPKLRENDTFLGIQTDNLESLRGMTLAQVQQMFSENLVPLTLSEIIENTELHDCAKNALNGAREGQAEPFFDFLMKYAHLLKAREDAARCLDEIAGDYTDNDDEAASLSDDELSQRATGLSKCILIQAGSPMKVTIDSERNELRVQANTQLTFRPAKPRARVMRASPPSPLLDAHAPDGLDSAEDHGDAVLDMEEPRQFSPARRLRLMPGSSSMTLA
jgi:hypothetical protein